MTANLSPVARERALARAALEAAGGVDFGDASALAHTLGALETRLSLLLDALDDETTTTR